MGIDVNFVDKLIYISSPQQDIEAQELINEIRRAEATTSGISNDKVADAAGKEQLASGVYVGITIQLYDPWQLKNWQGNYQSFFTGGNLVRPSGANPVIAYTAGVQNILLQSNAATIVEPEGASASDIAAEVDVTLSASHGTGNWEGGGGLTESGIAYAVDQRLSEFHGSGSWEGISGGASASEVAAAVWDVQMSAHTISGTTAGSFLSFIRTIEGGGWKIDDTTNEMIFYKEDNVTEIARFNLFDKNDNPASEDVFRRDRS